MEVALDIHLPTRTTKSYKPKSANGIASSELKNLSLRGSLDAFIACSLRCSIRCASLNLKSPSSFCIFTKSIMHLRQSSTSSGFACLSTCSVSKNSCIKCAIEWSSPVGFFGGTTVGWWSWPDVAGWLSPVGFFTGTVVGWSWPDVTGWQSPVDFFTGTVFEGWSWPDVAGWLSTVGFFAVVRGSCSTT